MGLAPIAAVGSELTLEMIPEVVHDLIVVEQGVINVQQDDDLVGRRHALVRSGVGLCHGPSLAMSASAFFGPQLPRR